jgi:hypothetical protein
MTIDNWRMITKDTQLFLLMVAYLEIRLIKTLMIDGASSGEGKRENHLTMMRITI